MYDNYIFDLYGTLVDIRTNEEKAYLWQKMSELYSSLGAAYAPGELRREFRCLEKKELRRLQDGYADRPDVLAELELTKIFQALFREKNVPCDRQTAGMMAIFFRTLSRKFLRVYDGVEDTLQELRGRGKHLYLLSNAQSDFTRPELEMLGLAKYFDSILISSEEGCRKPCPAFFHRLLERYELDPFRCLMVGNDEYSDIGGAASVGMDSLYIHTSTSSQPQGRYKPVYCVMDGDWAKAADFLLGRRS